VYGQKLMSPKQHQSSTTINARLTKGSKRVLNILKKETSLATAQDIHLRLRSEDEKAPGLTTVYRALDSLLELGLVQSVELGDGERRFELVAPGEHHHHLVCQRCHESIHLDQCLVEELESAIRAKYGFEVRAHILEMFGVCKRCK